MIEYVKCNICNSDKYKILYKARSTTNKKISSVDLCITNNIIQRHQMVKCKNCGLVYVNPRDKEELIQAAYGELEDDMYFDEIEAREVTFGRCLTRIGEFISRKGRLLDIGCGGGILLNLARNSGWEVYGVELSRKMCEYAKRQFALEIVNSSLIDAKFPSTYFDVIVLADVIEHVVDPQGILSEIKRMLKPQGLLFLTTPDIGSPVARLLRHKWWCIFHAHIYYFSRKTIRKILENTEFEVLKIRTHGRIFRMKYWVNRLRSYQKIFYHFFSLFMESTGFSEKYIYLNFGDQMEVYAKKKQ